MNSIGTRDRVLISSACVLTLVLAGPAVAKDGFYLGIELGASASERMDVWGSANDVATACDEFFVTRTPETPGCDAPPSSWVNIDRRRRRIFWPGVAGGDPPRELEVRGRIPASHHRLRRHQPGSRQRRGAGQQDRPGNRTGHCRGQQLLGAQPVRQLCTTTSTRSRSSLHTWGWESATARCRWITSRPGSAMTIRNTSGPFPTTPTGRSRDLNRRVAGTTTVGDDELKDTLFGYQFLAGVDYRVSDTLRPGTEAPQDLVQRVLRHRRIPATAQPRFRPRPRRRPGRVLRPHRRHRRLGVEPEREVRILSGQAQIQSGTCHCRPSRVAARLSGT